MNSLKNLLMNPSEKFYLDKLTQDPEDLHSMLRLGEFYIRRGKKKKGIDLLTKVSKLFYEKGKVEYSLAINRILKKRFPDLKIDVGIVDNRETEKVSVFDILKNIEIFKELSDNNIKILEQKSAIKEYKKNDIIVKEGEPANCFYVILKGNVKIYITTEVGKIVEVCILGRGDFFGEMSFFEGVKRNASVDAIDDVLLLEIPREAIEELKRNDEKVESILFKYYQRRALDIILSTSKTFSTLDESLRKTIISHLHLKKFQPYETIIKQGEYGTSMYIIKSGIVEVYKEEGGEQTKLAELKEGDVIGEIGVLTGQTRTATVVAKTEVELMELKKDDVDLIISKYPNFLDILKEITHERLSHSFMKQAAIKKGAI